MTEEPRVPQPKYVPRQFLQDRSHFGSPEPGLRWHLSPQTVSTLEIAYKRRRLSDPDLRARAQAHKYLLGAAVHHEYAIALRDIVARDHIVEHYVDLWRIVGLDPNRMNKFINGNIPLPLDELGNTIYRLEGVLNISGWLPTPDKAARSVALASKHLEQERASRKRPTLGLMSSDDLPHVSSAQSTIRARRDVSREEALADYVYAHARGALVALNEERFAPNPTLALGIEVAMRLDKTPGTADGFPWEDEIIIGLHVQESWVHDIDQWGLVLNGKIMVHFNPPPPGQRPTSGLAARVLPESISTDGTRMGDWRIVESPVTITWDGDRPVKVDFTIKDEVEAAKENSGRTGTRLNRYP